MLISEFVQNEHPHFPDADAEIMKTYHGYSRGVLPHLCYQNGMYFISTRLYDSVPDEVIRKKYQELLITEEMSSCIHETTTKTRELSFMTKLWTFIQDYEDSGKGQCFLRDPRIAKMVLDAPRFYDGRDYRLLAWSIMPNHIHFLIKLLEFGSEDTRYDLSKIMRKIKGYTANQANKILHREGQQFWQKEYFDRYIRDVNHLRNTVKYIINNPRKIHFETNFTGTIFDDENLFS